jgi:chromosome segregation protein
MRLKKLIVRGFKSFADRTEFDFDADLTGIVGPNGCGKSNVVDALKWVLGDQRAKSLRGSEMTDVIFKGAEGREGMHMAEVSVELEDGEPESTEGVRRFSIGRRLTKDRESTYLLDGESVRLRDVRSALMDTGLGVHAYAVMEQGRIDAVLSANPEDRRAIFEEAAGISRFKIQKKETLRKLERTEQNLARVGDLLQERERRIRGLKAQAGRARRHAELTEELRELRVALAVCEAGRLQEQRQVAEEAFAEAEARAAEGAGARSAIGTRLDELEARISAAAREVSVLAEELAAIQSRRDAAHHRAQRDQERAEGLLARADESDQRRTVLAEQLEERRAAMHKAQAEVQALEERRIELSKEHDALRESTRAAQQRMHDVKHERERARGAMLELVHERTRCRNLAHDEETQARGATARLAKLEARLAELARERQHAERALEGLANDTARLEAALARRREREQRLLESTERADEGAGELARRESSLRERIAGTDSRLEMLRGMEAGHEGVDAGPRRLLELSPEGLRGRLIDMLDVDLEFSRALEAALGPYVQALVVETREQAEAMLDQLLLEDGGRALLLVREEFDPDFEDCCCMQKLPEGAELLARKLRVHPDVRPVLFWILRGVALVEELDPSYRAHPDICFVTPAGHLSCGPRLEGGRGESAGAGLVVRKAQIQQLAEERAELDREREALQVEITTWNARVERLRTRLRTVSEGLRSDESRIQKNASDHTLLMTRLEQAGREGEAHRLECVELRRQRAGALADLGHHLLDEVLLRRRERMANEREQELAQESERAREAADAAVAREHDLRVEQTTCAAERDKAQQAARMHGQAVAEHERSIGELEERSASARADAEQAKALAEEARGKAAEEQAAFEAKQQERAGREEQAVAIQKEREELLVEARGLEAERDELQQRIADLRLEIAQAIGDGGRLQRQLLDEIGVGLDWWLGHRSVLGIVDRGMVGPPVVGDDVPVLHGPELPPDRVELAYGMRRRWLEDDFDEAETRKSARALQGQIDRLGSVNVDAVRELAEEEEGLGSLQADHEDLQSSRKQLYEALKTMERESRDLFEKTFAEARENFRTIFRKLFQGGRADMYLTEDEGGDALEAGIDIVAKPPGKELQSIALLSGGERSLTALAILFAVFKVKPSPFCILDEVDAALDETNVERFLRVLRDFVGPTQFCIVTHHKRTMADCQALYGITMQKRGVSTRIAVDLREVDDLAGPEGQDPAAKARIAGEEAVGF